MTSLDNYSKWDNIQLSSDDDEDCHPNIEKYTWRRLRAQQRAEQRVKEDQEAERVQAQIKALEEQIENYKKYPSTAQTQATISRNEKEISKLKAYLEKQEKIRKLNPEDLCQESFDSTIVNKNADLEHVTPPALQKKLDENKEVNADEFGSWQSKHESTVKEYLACTTLEKSRDYVLGHPELLNNNATGWILLEALNREMAGDSDAMHHAVRQNQYLQYSLDLSKLSGQAPTDAARGFFSRLEGAQQRAMFERDVDEFALKIKERAIVKKKEQLGRGGQQGPELPTFKDGDTEYQVLSKAERMGPGGLDPLEVLETLPPAMKAVSVNVSRLAARRHATKPNHASHKPRFDGGLLGGDSSSLTLTRLFDVCRLCLSWRVRLSWNMTFPRCRRRWKACHPRKPTNTWTGRENRDFGSMVEILMIKNRSRQRRAAQALRSKFTVIYNRTTSLKFAHAPLRHSAPRCHTAPPPRPHKLLYCVITHSRACCVSGFGTKVMQQ